MTWRARVFVILGVTALVSMPLGAPAGAGMNLTGSSPANHSSSRSAAVSVVMFTYDVDLIAPPRSTLAVSDPSGVPLQGSVALCGAQSSTGGQRSICFTPSAHLTAAADPYSARSSVFGPGQASSSDTTTFTIDDTAPAAPVITSPKDPGFINGYLMVSGTAEPYSTVSVAGWKAPLSISTSSDGGWVAIVSGPDGSYALAATATDAAGNVSRVSSTVRVTIDTIAPPAPVVTTPPDGGILTGSTLETGGTAEPLAQVWIFDGDTLKGSPTASPAGAFTAEIALDDGAHTITAFAIDRAGNRSATTPPLHVWIDSRNGVPRVDQPVPDVVVADPQMTIAGFGRPGWTAMVREAGAVAGTATIGADGRWTLTRTFSEARHTLSVTAVDPGGVESAAQTVSFTVDLHAPDPPQILKPPQQVIRAGVVAISGRAEPNAFIALASETKQYANARADAAGAWSARATLDDGTVTIAAYAMDAAGNVSEPGTLTITADGTRPTAHITTQDQTVLLPGTSVTGTADDERGIDRVLVTCTDPRNTTQCYAYATLTKDASERHATWALSPGVLLPGVYTVGAQAFDEVGNPSMISKVTLIIA
ncbi:MAG: Ig-like domain-containing protein [Actinomycetota bacterium]